MHESSSTSFFSISKLFEEFQKCDEYFFSFRSVEYFYPILCGRVVKLNSLLVCFLQNAISCSKWMSFQMEFHFEILRKMCGSRKSNEARGDHDYWCIVRAHIKYSMFQSTSFNFFNNSRCVFTYILYVCANKIMEIYCSLRWEFIASLIYLRMHPFPHGLR